MPGTEQEPKDTTIPSMEEETGAKSLRKHVPSGAAVGVMPSREKKLKFVAGDADPTADARLRAMIENLLHLSPYSMCITDMQKQDEPIVYANEMFCKWTEYPEDYIVGRNCRFLQGPETIPETVKAMRAAINAGQEFRGVIRNYSRTGTHLWNNLVMTPVKNADGFVTHYTGIQIFSHEPPNATNTPLPPKETIFNPLSPHVKMWKDRVAKESSGKALEAAQLLSVLEASSHSVSPKIMPKAAASGSKEEDPMAVPKVPAKIDPRFANSPYLQKPGSPTRKPSGSASPKSPSSPKAAAKRPAETAAVPDVTLNVPTFTPRRRSSAARRQGGHCRVVPDKDVWLELLVRSLDPSNVPMLPQQPEGPVEKSHAMTAQDFSIAQQEAALAQQPVH